MKTPALISRYFRIATSGPTVDKREISADDLIDMAANYDADEYTASINIEHIRGISPWSAFGSLGTVAALKTKKDAKGRTQLLAQVIPTPYMIQLKDAGQKLFSSMEIQPDFAGSGKPYLVGLAVTDTPASLGVEAMQFSAKQKDGPAVDDRFRNNLFTSHLEIKGFKMKTKETSQTPVKTPAEIAAEGGAPTNELSFADKFKARFAKKETTDSENFGAIETAMLELADKFTSLETEHGALVKKFEASEAANKAQGEEITKLSAALDGMPEGGARPEATPAEGENQTDC